MKKTLLALAGIALAGSAFAQTATTYTSGTYSQNFNTVPYNTNGSDVAPVGTPVINGTTYTLPAAGTAYDLTTTVPGGSSVTGWYANGPAKNVYAANGGSTTTGGSYSFGGTSGASLTDRALGVISTSTTGAGELGLLLFNSSATTYNQITLSYGAELWHQGTAAKSLNFGYAVSSSLLTLPSTGLTSVSGLGSGSFSTGSVQSTDLSAPVATNSVSSTVSLGSNWNPNSYLWLTWTINSTAGSGQGIGIDDLAFTANSVFPAANVVWNATSGTWDTTSGNWTGGNPTANLYKDSDNATFSGASGGTITIQAGGVSPGSVTVSATSGTYTFTGGAINGSGALAKSNGGVLVLSASNGYGGGTNLNGGLVIADGGDSRLGAAAGGITFGGGTLRTDTAGIASARAITVGTGGGTFNTNGFDSSTSNTTAINDTLTKSGAGDLSLNGVMTFGSAGALNISGGSVSFGQSGATIDQSNGGIYNGNLVIKNGGPRLNFNGTTAFTGTGQIQVQSTGLLISNKSGVQGATVYVPLLLNSTGIAFTKGDVTQAAYTAGSFVTNIGGTKLAAGNDNTLTLAGVVSGDSDVNIANSASGGGSGNLTLNAKNTYTGVTTVNTGNATLILGIDDALPTTTDLINNTQSGASGTATLNLNGFSQHLASLSSGTAGGTMYITNSGTADSVLTVNGSNTPSRGYSGVISDGATNKVAVVKDSDGTLRLTGNNTYTGGTTLNSGTLALGSGNILADTGAVNINGGTLDTKAHNETVGAVAITSGTITSTGGAGTLASSSALTKSGTGAATVASGATYSGGAEINGGTLFVSGTVTGITNVNNGGTLGGSGKLASIHVALGGTLSPGNSPAQITADSLSLDSGATLKMEIGGLVAGTDNDQIVITATDGTVTLGGATLDLHLIAGFTPATDGSQTFILIDNQSTVATTGTFAGLADGSIFTADGSQFQIHYNTGSDSNDVTVTAVPEPSTWGMLAGGLVVLVVFNRRRKATARVS